MKRFFLALALTAALLPGKATAMDPTKIEIFTLAFGTMSYSMDTAVESLLKELNSPFQASAKPIPSILYVARYYTQNIEKMREGKVPQIIFSTTANAVPYMAQGLEPYTQYPMKGLRILCVTGGFTHPFITLDKKLRKPEDLQGKKVAIPEKARANQSELPQKPVFDNAYGGFDKVKWQYLGAANGKDAFVNGSVDVYLGSIVGPIAQDEQGHLVMERGSPDPSLMEAMSTGKPYQFITEDPEVLKKAYNSATDMVFLPVLTKAGTHPGQTEDFWSKGTYTVYAADESMSDEAVAQFVCDLFQNQGRLAEYYAGFANMGNPYPIGSDPAWVHPGLFLAMERMGMELPAGVTPLQTKED